MDFPEEKTKTELHVPTSSNISFYYKVISPNQAMEVMLNSSTRNPCIMPGSAISRLCDVLQFPVPLKISVFSCFLADRYYHIELGTVEEIQ